MRPNSTSMIRLSPRGQGAAKQERKASCTIHASRVFPRSCQHVFRVEPQAWACHSGIGVHVWYGSGRGDKVRDRFPLHVFWGWGSYQRAVAYVGTVLRNRCTLHSPVCRFQDSEVLRFACSKSMICLIRHFGGFWLSTSQFFRLTQPYDHWLVERKLYSLSKQQHIPSMYLL